MLLRDIYAILGVSPQTLHKWRHSLTSTQTRENLKRRVVVKADELFSLNLSEMEALANKAGLSLYGLLPMRAEYPFVSFSVEIAPDTAKPPRRYSYGENFLGGAVLTKSTNIEFVKKFNDKLSMYQGKIVDLCNAAMVSERMFRHIRTGHFLRKEPILALLIVMNLCLDDIQKTLRKAGFVLSCSIFCDLVVTWMLENEAAALKGAKRLNLINETLDSLGLGLLMTKTKD